jgi:hypothetical protein
VFLSFLLIIALGAQILDAYIFTILSAGITGMHAMLSTFCFIKKSIYSSCIILLVNLTSLHLM